MVLSLATFVVLGMYQDVFLTVYVFGVCVCFICYFCVRELLEDLLFLVSIFLF